MITPGLVPPSVKATQPGDLAFIPIILTPRGVRFAGTRVGFAVFGRAGCAPCPSHLGPSVRFMACGVAGIILLSELHLRVGGKDRWTEGLDIGKQHCVVELRRSNGCGSGRGE